MGTVSHQPTTTPDGLEYALLGLLRREPLHAYEMYQRLRRGELLGHIWQLKQSHLYAGWPGWRSRGSSRDRRSFKGRVRHEECWRSPPRGRQSTPPG